MGSDGNRRGPWSQSEDRRLLHFINEDGPQNWVAIAQEVGGRSAKQCRERYHQNLKPGLNHSPINEDEASYILTQVAARGPRWAEISRELKNNRSDNAVKNWWNGYYNRTKRLQAREKSAASASAPGASSSRPATSDAQQSYLPPFGASSRYGPAPLPSPTETGFSPRTRETASGWPRDTLPPSPSSVTSDHSASSRTRFESFISQPPQRQPSYYASSRDTLPPISSPAGRTYTPQSSRQARSFATGQQTGTSADHSRPSNWPHNEFEYGLTPGSWDRPTALEELRFSTTGAYAAPEVPRSELRQIEERQYYHSHSLPRLEAQHSPQQAGVRNYAETRGTRHSARSPTEAQASRTRDERMSVSALMD